MLRAELKDSDIPHRTKIRKRIMEIWDEHLNTLQQEMAVRECLYFAVVITYIIIRMQSV